MTQDLTLEAQVQQVINEMLIENLLPFVLNVGKITKDQDRYTIHFYDSRMPTAEVLLTKGESLRNMTRSAVLARVAKISGPLNSLGKV